MGAACGARHRRRWVALTVSSALLIAGLCGYLYVSVQDLSDDLKCAGDQVSALEDPAGSVGATAVENVPSWMRRAIGQGGAYFDLASLGYRRAALRTSLGLLLAWRTWRACHVASVL